MSDRPPSSLEDQIDLVATRVARLSSTVRELTERQQGDTAKLDERINGLQGALGEVRELIEALAAQEKSQQVRAWHWPDLSVAEASTAWNQLTWWVEHVLLARHPHQGIDLRPCWPKHPAVVDELTALYVAWASAYRSDRSLDTAASEWLDRWLPAGMGRIRQRLSSCGRDHEEPQTQPMNHELLASMITADLARRETTPEASEMP